MHISSRGLSLRTRGPVNNASTGNIRAYEDKTMRNFLDAKLMAKTLRQGLAERNVNLSHSECLELVARQFGFAEWNMLAARLGEVKHDETKLTLPKDWIITGPIVDGSTHRLGLDLSLPGTALIESLLVRGEGPDLTGKIAVLMQSVQADLFRGQRLKLTANLKTESADIGTIWLRVDTSQKTGMRFDNMLNRTSNGPLEGTQDWTACTIILDVPEDAESIHYGFFLKGYGKVWARSFELESVGDDIEPTALHSQYLARPSNLDFSRPL